VEGACERTKKEASHTPGTLPPEGALATQSVGFPLAPPRSTKRARGPFYPFYIHPPNEGWVRKTCAYVAAKRQSEH